MSLDLARSVEQALVDHDHLLDHDRWEARPMDEDGGIQAFSLCGLQGANSVHVWSNGLSGTRPPCPTCLERSRVGK